MKLTIKMKILWLYFPHFIEILITVKQGFESVSYPNEEVESRYHIEKTV